MRSRENNTVDALFVVGVGRSGTTMVYDMLSVAKPYRWISRVEADLRPSRLLNGFAMSDHRKRMVGGDRRSRWFSPSEAYVWWDRVLPRFAGIESPVVVGADLTSQEKERVANAIRGMVKDDATFLNKNTRNSRRIGMLADLPGIDSRFIHVVRHPIAVALSMARVAWWPKMPVWFRNGETPESIAGDDLEANLTLASELWLREMQSIRASLPYDETALTVRYEDVAADPAQWGEAMAAFAGDPAPHEVGEIATKFVRPQGRHRWSVELTDSIIDGLWAIVGEEAERYGYSRDE